VGDFNMRLGELTGDHHTNSRGYSLPPYLDELNLHRIKAPLGHPTYQLNPNAWSIIDYIYSQEQQEHARAQVFDSYNVGGTDHFIVSTRIKIQENLPPRMKKRTTFNLTQLKKEEVLKIYCELTSALLQELPECELSETQSSIEALDQHITSCVETAATLTLGKTMHNRYKSPFVSSDLRIARRERQRWHTKIRNAKTEDTKQLFWLNFKKARAKERKEVKYTLRKSFDNYSEKLSMEEKASQQRLISRLLKSKKKQPENQIDDNSTRKKTFDYYYNLYNKDNQGEYEYRRGETDPVISPEAPFTVDQVQEILKKIPRGKASGPLGLPGELFQAAAQVLARYVYILFKNIWNIRKCPTSWTKTYICPIFKKGDPYEPSNYRPICLSEILRKCFEKCIHHALGNFLGEPHITQGGFRKKRGTIDQIACLDTAIKRRIQTHKQAPCMVFLDIKAAYDSVDRSILWKRLYKEIPRSIVEILQALFDFNHSYVLLGNNKTDMFYLGTGLLQGSILSPMLYAYYIDGLPKEIIKNNFSEKYGLCEVFLYADDIALISNTEREMQQVLHVCEQHARENKYKFAAKKCVHLAKVTNTPQILTLDGEEIPREPTFTYLGMTFGVKGIMQQAHAQEQRQELIKKLFMLRSVGLNGTGFRLSTSRMIYLTFLRPILEYGLQLLTNIEAQETLQKTQNFALRMICSAPQGTSTGSLHSMFGIPYIATRHIGLRSKWINKVATAHSGYLVHNYNCIPLKQSVFNRKKNTILCEEELPELQNIQEEVKKYYKNQEELLRQQEQDKQRSVPTIKNLLIYLDGYKDRRMAKRMLLWALRRPFGRPKRCCKCGKEFPDCNHLQDCIQANIDMMLQQQQWKQAAVKVSEMAYVCLNWKISNNSEWENKEKKKKSNDQPPQVQQRYHKPKKPPDINNIL
jgi:hypothetical protein